MTIVNEEERGRGYPDARIMHPLDFPTNQDPDFIVDVSRDQRVIYYTPNSWKARDWASRHLKVDRHGASFMFSVDNIRGHKLRGYLKGEGFSVDATALPKLTHPDIEAAKAARAKTTGKSQ